MPKSSQPRSAKPGRVARRPAVSDEVHPPALADHDDEPAQADVRATPPDVIGIGSIAIKSAKKKIVASTVMLAIAPLTKAAFAPFGEVIDVDDAPGLSINQGFAQRFDDLAGVDVTAGSGIAAISIFTAMPRPRPIAIKLMERHPLGTQAFIPLQDKPWIVLVCAAPDQPSSYRAFAASGRQGVNYGRNVWHHPLLVCDRDCRYVVVDRKGPGVNLEEHWLDEQTLLYLDLG